MSTKAWIRMSDHHADGSYFEHQSSFEGIPLENAEAACENVSMHHHQEKL